MEDTDRRPIVLTGIKPTGRPHLGNYLGSIRPALELSRTHEAYYFIADAHVFRAVGLGGPQKEKSPPHADPRQVIRRR